MPNHAQDNVSAAVATQMTLVFVVLKLAGQIDWPWLWVLCPLWIYVGLTVCTGVVLGFISAFSRPPRIDSSYEAPGTRPPPTPNPRTKVTAEKHRGD